MTLCHVDLYRLDAGDVETLDIEDFLETGIVAVEWAERFPAWSHATKVMLSVRNEEERMIVMEVEDVSRAQVWRHFGSEP
jgi:tRNA A37 threonylcarbamoyladenosine biosynthesis protein TsaE